MADFTAITANIEKSDTCTQKDIYIKHLEFYKTEKMCVILKKQIKSVKLKFCTKSFHFTGNARL